jgi:hypothetical protein
VFRSLEPNQGVWFGLFQSFDFAIGTSHLTLNPSLIAGSTGVPLSPAENQTLLTLPETPSRYLFQFSSHLQEGAADFEARFLLEFSDPSVFPVGALAPEPPSLESATVRELFLYQPIGDGGGIFLASGTVNRFVAVPVPEPPVWALFLTAALGVLFQARKPKRHPEQLPRGSGGHS